MKTLLLAGVVVAALALGALWLAGGREQAFRRDVLLDVPPATAFRWLSEPPLLARWLGGFVESRPLGDGTLRVGARSLEIIEEGGRRVEMTSEVTALDPGRVLEVRLEAPGLIGTSRFELQARGAATMVSQTLTLRYHGMARLFGVLTRSFVQAKVDRDLARLAQAVRS
jgi:uncharacterized protein YndB with AHSA1/START domain